MRLGADSVAPPRRTPAADRPLLRDVTEVPNGLQRPRETTRYGTNALVSDGETPDKVDTLGPRPNQPRDRG